MKYIAAILVLIAFYWFYANREEPKTEPVAVHVSPQPGELSDVEKGYYIKVFDYVMNVLKDNESYAWQSSDVNTGKITVGTLFTSKSSSLCRPFSESFVIGDYQGNYDGIACKRGGSEGWCRLKKSDALTCALEDPANTINFNFPGVNTHVTIGTPSIGSSGTPAINAPQTPHVGGNAPQLPAGSKPSGGDVADKVTGAAGSVAGPVTGGAIKWFNSTFR